MGSGGEPEVDMSIRELKRRLEEILARPKVTRRDAEEAVEAAQAIADLMRAEERALRLVAGGEGEARSPGPVQRRTLAGLTLHAAAEHVLRKYGWPMHVKELALTILSEGWTSPRARETTVPRLALQLASRLPRYPERFRRTAPNTFSLAEWGNDPPRKERPRPLIGIFASDGTHAARDIDQELETVFEDERNQWRSY
jgi:hypothetical protein